MHALGLELFLELEHMDLGPSLRCKDEELRGFQERFCRGDTTGLVEFLGKHLLSNKDADTFADAPIIAPGNEERNFMNPKLLKRFAEKRGDRVISWHLPNSLCSYDVPVQQALNNMTENNHTAAKLLADYNPQLMGHFCAGSPMVFTSNYNPMRGVAKSVPGTLWGLAWTDPAREKAALEFLAANTGDVVLPHGLEPVVLARPHLPDSVRATWPAHLTLVPGDIVLPVEVKTEFIRIRGATGAKLTVKIEKPQFDLAFLRTIHKAQGASVLQIIVSLMHRPCKPPPPDFFAFNVAFTRTSDSAGLRLLVASLSDLEYIASLRPPPELLAFMEGYDTSGRWIQERAFKALERLRLAKPVPPVVTDSKRKRKSSAASRSTKVIYTLIQ